MSIKCVCGHELVSHDHLLNGVVGKCRLCNCSKFQMMLESNPYETNEIIQWKAKFDEVSKDIKELIQFLGAIGQSFLEADTGIKWSYYVEMDGWDAKVVYQQDKFRGMIAYEVGKSITNYFVQLGTIYYLWERETNNAKKA